MSDCYTEPIRTCGEDPASGRHSVRLLRAELVILVLLPSHMNGRSAHRDILFTVIWRRTYGKGPFR